jgi:hypothetical protein
MQRPSFARDFPPSPELDVLVEAFGRGEYASVRRRARQLVAQTNDEAVRRAAQSLIVRTRPDPLAVALLILAAAFVVTLSVWWTIHGRAPRVWRPPVQVVR